MPSLWPLKLPPFDRLSALLSLAIKLWSLFKAQISLGFAVHNLVAWQGCIWPSVLRQPAPQRSVPKGHGRFGKVTLNIQAIVASRRAKNIAAQWSAANPGSGYAVRHQIHGTGKQAKTLFQFAPQPNCSINPTPTSSACGYPARFALRCGLPRALGLSPTRAKVIRL